ASPQDTPCPAQIGRSTYPGACLRQKSHRWRRMNCRCEDSVCLPKSWRTPWVRAAGRTRDSSACPALRQPFRLRQRPSLPESEPLPTDCCLRPSRQPRRPAAFDLASIGYGREPQTSLLLCPFAPHSSRRPPPVRGFAPHLCSDPHIERRLPDLPSQRRYFSDALPPCA